MSEFEGILLSVNASCSSASLQIVTDRYWYNLHSLNKLLAYLLCNNYVVSRTVFFLTINKQCPYLITHFSHITYPNRGGHSITDSRQLELLCEIYNIILIYLKSLVGPLGFFLLVTPASTKKHFPPRTIKNTYHNIQMF